MNYHIMIDDKFIAGFINDSENVSIKNINRYFIRGLKKNALYVNHPKAEWVGDVGSDDFRNILNRITDKDKIFVHWYDLCIGKLMLTIDKNIPLYVVYWGGEFYEDPFPYHIDWICDAITRQYVKKAYIFPGQWPKHPIKILKHLWWLLNYKNINKKEFELKRLTVRRINYLLLDPNLFSADFDKIKSIYELNELHGLPFVYNQNFDLANELRTVKIKDDKINVQIGNSANESNNHADCIKALEKFNNKNIKIILPLSYGALNYAEFVKKYCLKTFLNKCEFIEKFMSRIEYVEKLKEVDVAVMFHNRSQAFGNCITLLTLGKKLYIKSDNPFSQLFQKVGIVVFDAKTIKDITFEEFSRPLTDRQIQSNIEKISNLFSEKRRLEDLSNLLN